MSMLWGFVDSGCNIWSSPAVCVDWNKPWQCNFCNWVPISCWPLYYVLGWYSTVLLWLHARWVKCWSSIGPSTISHRLSMFYMIPNKRLGCLANVYSILQTGPQNLHGDVELSTSWKVPTPSMLRNTWRWILREDFCAVCLGGHLPCNSLFCNGVEAGSECGFNLHPSEQLWNCDN